MTIFLDFDNTLFDCPALKEQMFKTLNFVRISKTEFFKIYKEVFLKGYTNEKFVNVLQERKDFDAQKALIGLERLTKNSRKFLYKDVIWFLEKYKNDARLILVSWGDVDYQKEKINNSGIIDYFDKAFFTVEKKYPFLNNYIKKNSINYFINDNPLENKEILRIFPEMKILTIKRPEGKIYNKSFYQGFEIFKDLNSISNYIHNSR